MSDWWIRDRGRVMGPFGREDILEMRANGQVQGFHECSRDRRTWQPIEDEVEFVRAIEPRRKVKPREERDPVPPMARSPVRSAEGAGFKLTSFGIMVSVIIGVIVTGVLATLLLLLSKSTAPVGTNAVDVISLKNKSDTEKTRLLESAVCLVVPGHIVTTAKGESLEGFLLLTEDGFSGGTGSGFVISADGYIITNRHVVASFSNYRKSKFLRKFQEVCDVTVQPQIWVFFGGDQKHPATLEYESPDFDLALLKIESPRKEYFALCDTSPAAIPFLTELKAVGFPGKDSDAIDVKGKVEQVLRDMQGKKSLYLFPSVEQGLPADSFKVSSRPGEVNRRAELKRMSANQKDSYVLRHNAQIFPGNSGGPLVSKDGTVIGINTWGLADPGIGFALTLPQLRPAIDSRVKGVVWRPHPE